MTPNWRGPLLVERALLLFALITGVLGTVLGYVGIESLAYRDPVFAGDMLRRLAELTTLRFPAQLAQTLPASVAAARWLLPSALFTLIALALVRTMRSRLALVFARWERGHVIVCGTGRAVAAAMKNLRDAGHRVVALQPDGPIVAGVLHVRGDPSDVQQLQAVSATAARAVVIVGDDDTSNLSTGLAAKSLFEAEQSSHTDPVICVVRVDEDIMRENAAAWLQNTGLEGIEFRLFTPNRHAVRTLLKQHPLARSADVRGGQRINILLCGTDPLSEQLLLEILANGHHRADALRVTVIGELVEEFERVLIDRLPEAGKICELSFLAFDPSTPRHSCRELLAKVGAEPLTGVYLVTPEFSRNLRLASVLRDALREAAASVPPIVVRTDESVLQHLNDRREFGRSAELGAQDLFSVDALLESRLDDLARVQHDAYLARNRAQGMEIATLPAGRPWSQLPETFKGALRRQADHSDVMLRALGLVAFADGSDDAPDFAFSEAEIEEGAEIEHLRWMAERRLEGWRFAEKRNDRLKQHPSLVPYAELSEETKEHDRDVLRHLAKHIRRTGREIRRDITFGLVGEFGVLEPDARFDVRADELLQSLKRENSGLGPVMLSPLGDRASRRVARRALGIDSFRLRVVWPLPTDSYLALLGDGAAEFEELERLADQSFPLWLDDLECDGESTQRIRSGTARFLADRADRLIVVRSTAVGDGAGFTDELLDHWTNTGKPAPHMLWND